MSYDLKKEEDVREYLNNLGIEYRFGCFSEKNPSSCHLLGDYLETIKKDFEKAGKVYRANCEDSAHPRSCYKYANYLLLGRGMEKNSEDAFKYYNKGCDAGDADACRNGGIMCISKDVQDMPKDFKKGFELLSEGCEKGDVFSCHYMSGIFMRGVEGKVEKEPKKAFDYALKACNLGNMHACSNVSLLYFKGEGVEESAAKSKEFKQKAEDLRIDGKETTRIQFQQGT